MVGGEGWGRGRGGAATPPICYGVARSISFKVYLLEWVAVGLEHVIKYVFPISLCRFLPLLPPFSNSV